MIAPRLEVRIRAITQLSLGGSHPSPVQGVTRPSEGDDVMNEAGWQDKVRGGPLRHSGQELTGSTRRQGNRPWECRQGRRERSLDLMGK